MKKKGDALYLKRKGYDNSLNSVIDKKISLYKIRYFPEPYSHNKNKIKVKLDLSNYATKSDLKWPTSIDTSKFARKIDLAN